MIRLMRSQAAVCVLLGALLVTGCNTSIGMQPPAGDGGQEAEPGQGGKATAGETAAGESPAHSPGESAVGEWRTQEVPYDYGAMKDDVVIRLDEEPRLESPIRTAVGVGAQTYTLFFREAMDRSSVEKALKEQADDETSLYWYVEPQLEFRWFHDRQLQVRATPPGKAKSEEGVMEYRLNVKGARTLSGKVLAEPPEFLAVVLPPSQIWRVSLDGKQREQLTRFSVENWGDIFLDPDQRYVLLKRFTEYCECDARHPRLYAIYDTEQESITHYPVELMTTYRGEGRFYADRRGFFFSEPEEGVTVPDREKAVRVEVNGFVHGADFSRDRSKLIMAVGAEEQKENYDLVIHDLESGEQKRIAGGVKGYVITSDLDNVVLPVSFQDNGQQVTIRMRKGADSMEELNHRYDWKTGALTPWTAPVPSDAWSGYIESDDGLYQMYWNGGIYKGSTRVTDLSGHGVWLPGSHTYVYPEYRGNGQGGSVIDIVAFDADQNKSEILITDLPVGLSLMGGSKDGKWLYLRSHNLKQQ
ncbi:hypothetical protein KDJ56_08950 [Brevibacillus composti]|uniref:Lipoprotein n=1 Tax=Brevibacillus composti TaxID=2796470 RepID=A0ABX7Z7H4_9BACL|nr:hypothetical protein [Brevibacillus composti]QUO43056.1 hypothetical protein KDJ56_08950 [Brevibacillus composti]